MELDTTQIILEVINFLVLLWVLKRLFFKPVITALKQRQTVLTTQMAEIATAQKSIEAEKQRYASEWQKLDDMKAQKMADLESSLAAYRAEQLSKIDESLSVLKQQRQEQLLAEEKNILDGLEAQAVSQSLQFLTRLLTKFSSYETHQKMVDYFIHTLSQRPRLSSKQLEHIKIQTAYALTKEQIQQFTQYFGEAIEVVVSPELIAGVAVQLKEIILQANLRDECDYFNNAALP